MKKIAGCFLALFLMIVLSCNSNKQEVYQWRGPDRSGVYEETGLMRQWPGENPEETWYVEGIGNGFGSPVIAGDRLYITGEKDSMAVLHCLDLNGDPIWQSTLGKEWVTSYPGSRSAPTLTGKMIYVGTGMGDLYCVDQESGNILWSKDLKDDFSGIRTLHGHSEAPVVSGNMVYWTPGGEEYNVVALDRYTGELIWKNHGFGERSGYNQPGLVRLPERDLFVTFSAYHLMGFDAETGELLWSHEQDNLPLNERKLGYGDTHANTVLYDQGSIYYVAGDGNCGVRLDLPEDGSGITEKWRNREFDNFMGGMVKIGDFLYGGTTASRRLISLDASSGRIVDSLKIGSGAVITADSMLYYYNQRGQMNLIRFEEGDMEVVSSFRVSRGTGPHFAHPVIHRGRLYLRHGDALMVYELTK